MNPLDELVLTTDVVAEWRQLIGQAAAALHRTDDAAAFDGLPAIFGQPADDSPAGRRAWLAGLDDQLCRRPVVGLTVAFWPSRADLRVWSDLLRRQMGRPVAIQVNFDPDVIGGAIVECAGRRTDGSLAARRLQSSSRHG